MLREADSLRNLIPVLTCSTPTFSRSLIKETPDPKMCSCSRMADSALESNQLTEKRDHQTFYRCTIHQFVLHSSRFAWEQRFLKRRLFRLKERYDYWLITSSRFARTCCMFSG